MMMEMFCITATTLSWRCFVLHGDVFVLQPQHCHDDGDVLNYSQKAVMMMEMFCITATRLS